uniref:Uncharacterized protein n=1 Tax=Romanomermis culicivorax TaxID=13658 RepID=A0A915HFB8_ROMCU
MEDHRADMDIQIISEEFIFNCRSIYEVNKLDHIYHLTRWEKFQIGWRKFFHINTDSTLNDIQLSRFDPIETILGMYQGILEKNPDIAMYIGPLLTNRSTPIFIELEQDNKVYLNKKEACDGWLDLNTQNRGFSAICRARSSSRSSKNLVEFYLCENAIGIHRDVSKNDNKVVLINLGNGIDVSYGMHGYENMFVLGNGYKKIYGGNATNTFVLTGNETNGFIYGFGSQNTLDFSQFNPKGSVSYFMNRSLLEYSSSDFAKTLSFLKVEGIDSIKGRSNEADALWTSATLSKVDLQGGNGQKFDQIFIEDDSTPYNLTINVANHTKIINKARNEQFVARTSRSKICTSKAISKTLEVSSSDDTFLIHVNDVTPVNSIFGFSRIFLKGFTIDLLKSQVVVLGNVPMNIQQSNSELILQPIPLRFTKNETKIILTPNDVEYNQEIIVDRFLAKYSIFYSNMTDLVITDKFSRLVNDEFSSILILKDFYVFYKMRTLIVRFSNQVIKLKDKVRFAQNNLHKKINIQNIQKLKK